jgi:hypothetical protein
MSGLAAEKICGLCGADCSNKPRTKDKTGKYFCKECYAQAVARKREALTQQRTAVRRTPAAALVQSNDGAPVDGDFGLLNELLEQQSQPASSMPTARMCTHCHAPMAADAVVCVACGFNSQSGKSMSVKVKRAPRESSLGAWHGPLIFGAMASLILVGLFVAGQNDGTALGMFALFWLLASCAYLFWVVRAAGKHGGTILALMVFFIPFYYLYFVFAKYPGRYLKVATGCQLIMLALFFASMPAFERLDQSNAQHRKSLRQGYRVPGDPAPP